jgi:hypothetical protein
MAVSQPPINNRPGFSPAVRPLVTAVIGVGLAILLFSPAGIIYRSADLSFVFAPLIYLFVIRFAAQICGLYLPGHTGYKTGMVISAVLNGIAWALFFFLFLNNAPLLGKFSLFSHAKDFLSDLSKAAAYPVLFIAGITISKLADITRETVSGKAFYPIVNALGQFLSGLAVWQFLAAFSAPSGTLDKIGLIIFAGIVTIALSNIGHYGEDSKNPFMADAARWLTHGLALKFFIGAFIAAYILLIRPAIVKTFSYAAIVEWLIVCLIGWRLFSGIKNGIRLRNAVEVHEVDWKKHVQLLNNLQGAEIPRLGEIQEVFTGEGSRDYLLVYLTLLLHNNKVSPEEIRRILHPIIEYQDTKMPWFAFGWEQQRILKKNEAARRLILGDIMANLKYVINPASRKIEEQTHEQQ